MIKGPFKIEGMNDTCFIVEIDNVEFIFKTRQGALAYAQMKRKERKLDGSGIKGIFKCQSL